MLGIVERQARVCCGEVAGLAKTAQERAYAKPEISPHILMSNPRIDEVNPMDREVHFLYRLFPSL